MLRELFPEDLAGGTRTFYDAATRRVYARSSFRFATWRSAPAGWSHAGRRCRRGCSPRRWWRAFDAQRMGSHGRAVDPAIESAEPVVSELALPPITRAIDGRWWSSYATAPSATRDQRQAGEARGTKAGSAPPSATCWINTRRNVGAGHGRTPKVTYEAGNPPHIACESRSCYDVNTTRALAWAAWPCCYISRPNMRPVQITRTWRFLARPVSEGETGAAAEVSQAPVAVTRLLKHQRVKKGKGARGRKL